MGDSRNKGNIYIFTLHKSASMFLHKLSEYLCGICSIEHHSPNSGLDVKGVLDGKIDLNNLPGCVGPIRFYTDVPDHSDGSIILHLRDPRDMLVSMFYSYCYIHSGQVAANTEYRKEVAARGIDDFVLRKATEKENKYIGDYGSGGHLQYKIGNVLQRYEDYIENFVGRNDVIFVKYEEMVLSFDTWLDKFLPSFPLNDSDAVKQHLLSKEGEIFPKGRGEVMQHMRKVTPGDHRSKLKPETISELGIIFSDVLRILEYKK